MSISGRKTLADDWIALFWKTVTVLQLQLHEKATSQELKGYKHHPLDLALAPLAVDFKPSSATRNPRRAAPRRYPRLAAPAQDLLRHARGPRRLVHRQHGTAASRCSAAELSVCSADRGGPVEVPGLCPRQASVFLALACWFYNRTRTGP